MYIVKMFDDKSLVTVKDAMIYQGEKNADTLLFRIPNTYADKDLTPYRVVMEYKAPRQDLKREELIPSNSELSGYSEYVLNIDSEFTANAGIVIVRLLVLDNDDNFILKTSSILIKVYSLDNTCPEPEEGCIKFEVDPTVPEWAKEPHKPTYSAEEVGAVSDVYVDGESVVGEDGIARISSSGGGGAANAYNSLTKNHDYEYEATYLDIDYEYAIDYFKSKKPVVEVGACSSFVKDGKVIREFDWTYDNNVEFIVHTPAQNGRHAVNGVSSSLALRKLFVESRGYSELYKLVPFYLVDGGNDAGLVITTNVVPLDKGKTTGTVPAVSKEAEICSIMLPRYLLDRCSSATEAVELVRDHVSVFMPQKLHDMGYEQHYLVVDKEKIYCLEFVENAVVILDITEKPIMTNFYLDGVTASGKVYTPADVPNGNLPSSQGITDNGCGLERYNLIYDALNSNATPESIATSLHYTNSYKRSTSPFWYTEYVGDGLTVDNIPADFAGKVDSYIARYESRTRDDEYKTWQSVHTSIYDIANKTFKISTQEEDDYSEISFAYYTKEEVDNIIANVEVDLSDYYTKEETYSSEQVDDLLDTKQPTISDLATIRTGAGLGATAYQKPQTGIPSSDLASDVLPTDYTEAEITALWEEVFGE